MLHVDKGGVEPGEADDLDDLRIGDAARMRAEGKPALVHDALDPVFLHRSLLNVDLEAPHPPFPRLRGREGPAPEAWEGGG